MFGGGGCEERYNGLSGNSGLLSKTSFVRAMSASVGPFLLPALLVLFTNTKMRIISPSMIAPPPAEPAMIYNIPGLSFVDSIDRES